MKTNAFFFSRPWLEMYNVSVRVPRSFSGGSDGGGGNSKNSAKENARWNEMESKILAMLHVDAIFEVLKKLSPRDLVRASSVCKKWHSMIQHSTKSLWRTHCERAFRFFDRDAEETRRRCVELYSNNYKKMFYERNRIRTDGLYVSRNTYVKACARREIGTSKKEHRPARVVVYYRYFRFLENGEWYSKTSPEPVRVVKKTMYDGKKANEDSSVNVGWYQLDAKDKEERIHCQSAKMKPESGYVTTTHFWVRLRSRLKGASDRLDCVKLLLVDEDLDANEVLDENEIAEKARRILPTEENWESVDDYEALYRRNLGAERQGVAPGAYSGHPESDGQRDLQRGLNTLVFIPWEECDHHELNKDISEMDFYITG
jgi:F-box protein 9